MSIFEGSGVAIVTPFDEKGNIDYKTFEELVEFQVQNETDAIIVCGTTGEASTLTDAEQHDAIEFVVNIVNKRIPVIAGAGSNDTKHGVDLAKGAEEVGADACLLVTPYYNKTTQRGLYEHFLEYAKALDIPIILYNVPGRTGLNIAPKTAFELSKIDNIVGIKEASSNIEQIMEMAYYCDGNLDMYSGNDDHIVPILSAGGKGVISVIANIMPKETHDIVAYYLNGEHEKSLELQLKIIPLVKAIFSEVNPIPIKAALKNMGYGGYYFRRPLIEMSEEAEKILVEEMKKIKLI